MILRFTKDHEWIEVEGDEGTIGISKHAVEALGELVYVELPEVGAKFTRSDAFAVVESAKSASDVYMPISGEVIAINDILNNHPERINQCAQDEGWLVKIKLDGSNKLDDLMDQNAYDQYLKDNE
ncbi:MAG: glycine cleavage system H protein [Rickettsiales bacterium]|jgi:glycine cleavage system H protein